MKELDLYDDPVGNWYLCDQCDSKVFMTLESDNFIYCPYCATIITSFNDVGVCMDDCVIGSNFKKPNKSSSSNDNI